MKKFLSLLLALCLVCCTSALAVRAEGEEPTGEYTGKDDTEATTIVSVTISETYTVVIPPTVNIAFNDEETAINVKVSNLRLFPGNLLYVQPKDYGTLTDEKSGKTLPYDLTGLDTKGDVTALFFDKTGDANLTINIPEATWNATPAGSYLGTIAFNIAIRTFSE